MDKRKQPPTSVATLLHRCTSVINYVSCRRCEVTTSENHASHRRSGVPAIQLLSPNVFDMIAFSILSSLCANKSSQKDPLDGLFSPNSKCQSLWVRIMGRPKAMLRVYPDERKSGSSAFVPDPPVSEENSRTCGRSSNSFIRIAICGST